MIFNPLSLSWRQSMLRGAVFVFALTLVVALFFLLNFAPASAQEPLEPADLPDAHRGLPLYASRCANCHGPNAEGDGEMADRLPMPPRDYTDDAFRRTAVPSSLFQTITDGRAEGAMPPFGPASSNPIDEQNRWDLVAAIFSLGTPVEAIENGRVLYEENCLACHGEGGAGDGPNAADSAETVPDLTDLRYWFSRSNEMLLASLQDTTITDHTYDLAEDDLWDVIDYARTFSYVYADPQTAFEPISAVTIAGQVSNGTTGDIIADGTVSLRAFTQDLQEAASQTAAIGPDGRYSFELSDAAPDWVYMASVEYNDLNFSSNPERVELGDPQLELPIVVFDTTDDAAAININQVHMIMDFVDDTVLINEIYVLSNLRPAVYVGESGNPDDGTFQLALPTGAENVQFQRSFRSFENFLPATEVIPTEQGYADTVPIRPGDGAMNLLVSYELPYREDMAIGHPVFYETNSATIVVPDIGLEIEGEGWISEGIQQMGGAGSISSYSHPALAPGEAVSFSLVGRPTAAVVGGASTVDNSLLGILIGGSALLLAAGGAAYTVQNWRSEAEEAAATQADHVDGLLYAVVALDEAYEAGNVEPSQYQEQRAELMNDLAANWVASEGS